MSATSDGPWGTGEGVIYKITISSTHLCWGCTTASNRRHHNSSQREGIVFGKLQTHKFDETYQSHISSILHHRYVHTYPSLPIVVPTFVSSYAPTFFHDTYLDLAIYVTTKQYCNNEPARYATRSHRVLNPHAPPPAPQTLRTARGQSAERGY